MTERPIEARANLEHPNLEPPIIGVRDSGVGGLTVARRILQIVPHARLLYFADTAHVPYGDRSPDEVRFFALSISRFLLERGAQILVFACNTTSAYALDDAQREFSQPVIGMIAPGARAAIESTEAARIGVLATQATIQSGVYSRSIAQLQPDAKCFEIACPAFVPLIENGQSDSSEARRAARHYLQPLLDADVDTIILGCTHYPLVLPILQELAPRVAFIDPAEAVAREVAACLPPTKYFVPDACTKYFAPTYFVSGETSGVREWLEKLLPQTRNEAGEFDIQVAPVFDFTPPAKAVLHDLKS